MSYLVIDALINLEDDKFMITIDFVKITNDKDNRNHFFRSIFCERHCFFFHSLIQKK